jgi:ABC-type molybdenum transport system ATPase subunit/photorepair protein PhrA
MRRSYPLLFRNGIVLRGSSSPASSKASPPLIKFNDGTFYRYHPQSKLTGSNPALFPNFDFLLPSFSSPPQIWTVLGPSSSGKTSLLEVLRGQHICIPPTARSFPYLTSEDTKTQKRYPDKAILYAGFGSGRGGIAKGSETKGAYLSSRYESRREIDDFSVRDYLLGHTELNAVETEERGILPEMFDKIVSDLRLEQLLDLPVSNLSNGQTRRARIAKALAGQPELLLLDEPFMGLDPNTLEGISEMLGTLAKAGLPRLLLALRAQDKLPDWVTHLLMLGPNFEVAYQGERGEVLEKVKHRELGVKPEETKFWLSYRADHSVFTRAADLIKPTSETKPMTEKELPEALIEMNGVSIRYGDKNIVGTYESEESTGSPGLHWTIRRGDRWGVFGPNGSGKTTLLSLICSDHPQTYSQPILLFGRSRLPTVGQPGISIFDIQGRIGHSSPEIHQFYPKSQSVRQVIENAWAETFLSKPKLTHDRDEDVNSLLRWFQAELHPNPTPSMQPLPSNDYDSVTGIILKKGSKRNKSKKQTSAATYDLDDLDWADSLRFGDIPLSSQRLLLLLRAIARRPDLVILDESFSGMDQALRDKCLLFLEHGENSTAITNTASGEPNVVPSLVGQNRKARYTGLTPEQALICISHVREEVPDVVREWICLPEGGSSQPARFGKFEGPMREDSKRWDDLWRL